MKMPKENIDTGMFAPCGMNCLVCYKHCYHKKPCAGCLNSDKGKPEHCRKCKIKECIKIKELSYCFECSEYPCKQIKNLEKIITSGTRQALWKIANLSVNLVWKNLWICRKKSISVPNVMALFLFTIENVVSVKKK